MTDITGWREDIRTTVPLADNGDGTYSERVALTAGSRTVLAPLPGLMVSNFNTVINPGPTERIAAAGPGAAGLYRVRVFASTAGETAGRNFVVAYYVGSTLTTGLLEPPVQNNLALDFWYNFPAATGLIGVAAWNNGAPSGAYSAMVVITDGA